MAPEALTPWEARSRAFKVAKRDYREALGIARRITDPWYRCQALTYAAEGCPEKGERMGLLKEAFAAAEMLSEPNREVSVAAFPFAVLAKEHVLAELSARLDHLLAVIGREPSPVRRFDALRGILGGLGQADERELYLRVLPLFTEACLAPLSGGKRNKRGESSLAEAVAEIYRFAPEEAHRLADQIHGPVLRKRALERLSKAGAARD